MMMNTITKRNNDKFILLKLLKLIKFELQTRSIVRDPSNQQDFLNSINESFAISENVRSIFKEFLSNDRFFINMKTELFYGELVEEIIGHLMILTDKWNITYRNWLDGYKANHRNDIRENAADKTHMHRIIQNKFPLKEDLVSDLDDVFYSIQNIITLIESIEVKLSSIKTGWFHFNFKKRINEISNYEAPSEEI